ncbi:MAG: hypothetical protein WDW38_009041 [Sanguina aurantia]
MAPGHQQHTLTGRQAARCLRRVSPATKAATLDDHRAAAAAPPPRAAIAAANGGVTAAMDRHMCCVSAAPPQRTATSRAGATCTPASPDLPPTPSHTSLACPASRSLCTAVPIAATSRCMNRLQLGCRTATPSSARQHSAATSSSGSPVRQGASYPESMPSPPLCRSVTPSCEEQHRHR